MFRDGQTIYINGQQYNRIPKTSETVKKMQEEITRIKFFLTHAKFASKEVMEEKRKRLGKLGKIPQRGGGGRAGCPYCQYGEKGGGNAP